LNVVKEVRNKNNIKRKQFSPKVYSSF